MAGSIFKDPLILFSSTESSGKPASKITSIPTGFVDISGISSELVIDDSREVVEDRPFGPDDLPDLFGGDRSISGSFRTQVRLGETIDITALTQTVLKSDSGKAQIWVQPKRAELESSGTVTPAASAGNPQWYFSVVLSSAPRISFERGSIATITAAWTADRNSTEFTS